MTFGSPGTTSTCQFARNSRSERSPVRSDSRSSAKRLTSSFCSCHSSRRKADYRPPRTQWRYASIHSQPSGRSLNAIPHSHATAPGRPFDHPLGDSTGTMTGFANAIDADVHGPRARRSLRPDCENRPRTGPREDRSPGLSVGAREGKRVCHVTRRDTLNSAAFAALQTTVSQTQDSRGVQSIADRVQRVARP